MNFSQKFEVNDTIGCGILFSQKSIFYTINGRFINTAFSNIDLYSTAYRAAISFGNGEWSISANFGSKSFKFGLEDLLSNQYKEIYQEISEEAVDSKLVFDLVHDYLLHSGYANTLKAFESESSYSIINNDNEESKDDIDKMKHKLLSSTFYMQRKHTLGTDALQKSANFAMSWDLDLQSDINEKKGRNFDYNFYRSTFIGCTKYKFRDHQRRN